MANTKSAIKRTRKIKRQTAVNRSRKSRYRGALKKMNAILEKKDKKEDTLSDQKNDTEDKHSDIN